MDYNQSLAIWFAMDSIRERGAAAEANIPQPEEVFVPFHLPPVKPQPMEEAKPPVTVPGSKAMPIAA